MSVYEQKLMLTNWAQKKQKEWTSMDSYLKDYYPGNMADVHFARYFFACTSTLTYKTPATTEKYFKQAGFIDDALKRSKIDARTGRFITNAFKADLEEQIQDMLDDAGYKQLGTTAEFYLPKQ